jgi:C4-dicarboxylate-specific signal transduction histidine kinase
MKFGLTMPSGRRRHLLAATAAVLALAIFAADTLTPPDCVVGGLYVIVVLMAGQFCRGFALAAVSVGCVILTVLAQFLSHRLGNDETVTIGAVNTAASIVAILLSGYLMGRSQRSEGALRQAQADLTHVSRIMTMGELTASIAHEVNQPIAGIVANASASLRWLAGAGDSPEINEVREAANRIVRDGTRAAEIISRVRKIFAKGEAEHRPTNLNQLVRETVEILGNETLRYSVTVQTDLQDLPPVIADPVQLQQVIVNLVLNGIDAMRDLPGDRRLVVRSWQTGDGQIGLSVADFGKGLPPGPTDQLFDAFFTTKPHGTGLGLAISRTIMEAHQGRLSASPNQPRGAIFQITLPLQPAAN